MTLLRISFNVAKNKLLTVKNVSISALPCDVLGQRFISSMAVTKNLYLLSDKKKECKIVNLQLTTPQDKPLVLLLSWLMAKKNHIYKYANLYIDKGFDVLNVTITPWQLLWPTKGAQIVAGDILKFLDVNKSYAPLILHGFSIGGYLWGEVLAKMAQDQERYKDIIDRIVGQIWDSAADITEIPIGFPKAVFPKNPVLEKALRQYILYHMKTFDKVATCHYLRSSQLFHTTIVPAPTMLFLSKTDPVGALASNQRARENWENMGMKVYWNCFEDSPHVGHMYKYPKEYTNAMHLFVDKIGLGASSNEKLQVKI